MSNNIQPKNREFPLELEVGKVYQISDRSGNYDVLLVEKGMKYVFVRKNEGGIIKFQDLPSIYASELDEDRVELKIKMSHRPNREEVNSNSDDFSYLSKLLKEAGL